MEFAGRLILIPLFTIIAITGCVKSDIAPGTPECLVKKTKDLNKQSPCDDGAAVQEYKFQGKIVYTLFTGDCIADSGAEVIDSDCNHLGYLGGLAGGTKINGVEFSSHATFL